MPDPADDPLLKAADRLAAAAERLADLRPNADLEAAFRTPIAPPPPADDGRLRDSPLLDEVFGVSPPAPPPPADPTAPAPPPPADTPPPPPGPPAVAFDPTLAAVLGRLAAVLEKWDGSGADRPAGDPAAPADPGRAATQTPPPPATPDTPPADPAADPPPVTPDTPAPTPPPPADPTLAAVLGRLAAVLEKWDGGADEPVPLWHEVVPLEKLPAAKRVKPKPPPKGKGKPAGADVSPAVAAVRNLPGAAADPAAALVGVGDAASKAFGPVGIVVWETGKALAKLGEVAVEAARSQQQANFQLAGASAAMAGVQARTEAADLTRDREVGDRTAGSAEGLSDALTGFDDELVEIKVLVADLKNQVLTDILGTVKDLLTPVAEAAREWNEWRHTEAGERWFGKLPDPSPAGGFGDLAQEARAEDEQARARARRVFERMDRRADGR